MLTSSERSIFLQALDEGSPEARRAFLANACAGDEGLRAGVEELLRAHELPDNPLDEPLAAADGSDALPATLPPSERLVTERPGESIGPYRLREQIGEGGFGLVFVAEQQQPVQRKVALKVIKPGMDSQEIIARFEAERQALALMDHQNIARVFDAGTTDAGRPYFVMELVRGVPITEFCDQHQLDMRQRLKLLATVCSAVQHAHQKGIIHRDIKPTNVLITLNGETPVVKVIDFGVAKAIGRSLTDKTIYTRFTAMIGTPLYMSPEQAEMSGLDVDTRSDVYSLGVLLYELLTGTTPFDSDRLNSAGFDEVRRIICQEEPPKPSTRLTTIHQSLTTTSTTHRATPSRPHLTVPGDLDWIVMKAIEKDRGRRYESAGALAGDLRRFLREEPIEARPPSRLYQLRKFARRNRATLVTVFLVAFAMTLGTGVSVWQAARAVAERNDKEKALGEAVAARNEADEARRQVEEFAERLKEANILVTSGRAHARAERWAAAYVDLTQAIERQPNYYNAWVERASLELALGLWRNAAEDYSEAFELGVPADNPANWGIPQLFLFNGDEDRYREYCLGLIERSEQDSQGVSAAVMRSCVMGATPVTDPVELASRIEELLGATQGLSSDDRGRLKFPPTGDQMLPSPPDGPGNRLPGPGEGRRDGPRRFDFGPRMGPRPTQFSDQHGPPRPSHNWLPFPHVVMLYMAGLAHYRAEQYDDAVSRLRQAVDDHGWHYRSIAYPALAMAYHRTGQAEEAKEALASAGQAIDKWTEEMVDAPVGRMPLPWVDWIECHILYREAKILLTGFAPVDDPRLREIEEHARASLQNNE